MILTIANDNIDLSSLFVSIGTGFIALGALAMSIVALVKTVRIRARANKIAEGQNQLVHQANETAREAVDISKEALEITKSQTQVSIRLFAELHETQILNTNTQATTFEYRLVYGVINDGAEAELEEIGFTRPEWQGVVDLRGSKPPPLRMKSKSPVKLERTLHLIDRLDELEWMSKADRLYAVTACGVEKDLQNEYLDRWFTLAKEQLEHRKREPQKP